VWGVVVLGLLIAAVLRAEPPVDWEAALADAARGETELLYITEGKRSQEEVRQFYAWIIQEFSGSALAARFQRELLDAHLRKAKVTRGLITTEAPLGPDDAPVDVPNGDLQPKRTKYTEMLDAVAAYVKRYAPYVKYYPVEHLLWIVESPGAPDEERRAAFVALAPLLRPGMAEFAKAKTALSALPVSAKERLALARTVAEQAKAAPAARAFHLYFLDEYALRGAATDARAEYQRFLRTYGEDTSEGRAARRALLQLEGEEGQAALARFEQAERAAAAAIRETFAAVRTACAGKDTARAVQLATAAMDTYPAFQTAAGWHALLADRDFLAAAPEAQLPFLQLVLTYAPGGGTEDTVMALALARQPPAAFTALLAAYVASDRMDPAAKRAYCEKMARHEAVRGEAARGLLINFGLGEALDRLGITDEAADYYYTVGRQGWNTHPELGGRALQRAAAMSPGSIGGASAGWLRGVLAGEQGFALPPLARVFPFPPERKLPAQVIPPLEDARPAFAAAEGALAPARRAPEENLVRGQLPLGGSAQALALDGQTATVWQPAALPALLTVPLTRETTVRRIELHCSQPAYFTVSLLDRAGRVLAKYERDWAFQDYRRTTAYWPPASVTLTVLPVDGVRYVQVALYQFQRADGGVKELAVYGAAYPMRAEHLREPAAVPAGTTALRLAWEAEEPAGTVVYGKELESSRHFSPGRRNFTWNTGMGHYHYGVEFYGENLSAVLNYVGILRWQIDEGPLRTLEQPQDTRRKTYTLATGLSPGRHLLWVSRAGFPSKRDRGGTGNLELADVRVEGQCRVRPAIRFAVGARWGPWQGPFTSPAEAIAAVPAGATRYQVKVAFDNREMLGGKTGVLTDLRVTAVSAAPAPAAPPKEYRCAETLEAAVQIIAGRRVAVTYPKLGTPEEYAAAKAIAEKAGVYLVSDDLALLGFPTVPVVVGTPLGHRYARLAPGMLGIWNDAEYLNTPDGLVRACYTPNGDPRCVFVIGESPAAVARAAERLAQALPAYVPPAAPLRTFASHTLETIHAWQTHLERPPVQRLALRMGINDRRSLQFGLAANHTLTALRITGGPLRAAGGRELPAARIRPVGFYDFAAQYGDLRIPNALITAPTVPMAAQTATGVWVTVQTPKNAVAGVYHGTVTLSSGAFTQAIPLEVTVEPIPFPAGTRARFGSFSSASTHWFNEDPDFVKRAHRARAENEAEHGLNYIGVPMHCTVTDRETGQPPAKWAAFGGHGVDEPQPDGDKGLGVDDEPAVTPEPGKTPAPPAVRMDALPWKRYDDGAGMPVGLHGAGYLDFGKPVTVREIAVSLRIYTGSKLIIGWLAPDGAWQESAPQAAAQVMSWARNPLDGDFPPGAIVFRLNGNTSRYFRLRTDTGRGIAVSKVRAFTDMARRWPVTYDFSATEALFAIYDDVFREKGLPLPTLLTSVGGMLGDSNGDRTIFAEQLLARLQAADRQGRVVLTIGDEPGDITHWAEISRPYREAGLVTSVCHSGNYPNIADAVGVLNPWCPNYQHNVQRPFFRERQQAGDTVLWYCCGVPNTQLSGRPLDNLALYWMTAKWRFDGGQSYAAQDTNPALHTLPFRYAEGLDHRYVYLPDATILDTTRRELEAEGIRDYALVEYLRDQYPRLRAANADALVATLERRLDEIFEQVVPYRYGYADAPDTWFAGRDALYDLAIRATKGE